MSGASVEMGNQRSVSAYSVYGKNRSYVPRISFYLILRFLWEVMNDNRQFRDLAWNQQCFGEEVLGTIR
jgi:hypothetical protein